MDETKKIIASVLVGSTMVGGAILQVQPKEMTLTDSQLYLMTEILQDKVPQYDVSKYDIAKVSADYVKMQKYVKDDISGALSFCLEHRGAKECDLYHRISEKLNSVDL